MSSRRRGPLVPGRQVYRLPHRTGTMGLGFDPLRDAGRWWEQGGDAGASAARDVVTVLHSQHGVRHMIDALYVGLYEGQPPYWLGAMAPRSPLLAQSALTMDAYTKARANLIRRCIDTAASMIAKNPAEIRCETYGGSWKLQKRAKQQTKFVNGILRESGFHRIQQRVFVDGCLVRGGGLAKFTIDECNSTIRCDRVHTSHIVWNDYEGSEPRNLYERAPRSRSELMERYPSLADQIRDTPFITRPVNQAYRRMSGNEQIADLVEVTDAYHLSAGADKPGRHIMCLANVTLLDEEWPFDFFPYARFTWADSDIGWAGSPMADQLVGYHIEIGKAMRKISRAQTLANVPRVFLEQGSEIQEDEISNEIGGLIHYRGTPPTIAPASALPAEFYQYLDWLFQQAMADVGINELQSQGQKPMGLDSGKALREYNDTGSQRQILKGQRLERQTEQAAEIVFRLAAKLAETNKEFAVTALGNRSFERIAWRDVEGDHKDIRFRTNPVSALSSTTAGRIQDVTDLIKGGLLPPEEIQGGLGLKLLNFPDLEKVVTIETATRELVEMTVDEALYEGRYLAPEPYLGPSGLMLLKTMAYRSYAHALQMDDVPERHMDLLRRLMSEANDLAHRNDLPQIAQPMAAVPPPAPTPLQQSPISPPVAPGGVPAPISMPPGGPQ